MLSHRTQHTDAHLVGATKQLQPFLVLGADLPVEMTRLIHQLVSLECRRLIMRLDVRLTIIGQAHETRLHGLVASANAEITEGLTVHVRERGELWKLAPRLVVDVGQVTPQRRSWSEGCATLWAAVQTRMINLVPVDLDAFKTVGITAGDSDWVPECLHAQ